MLVGVDLSLKGSCGLLNLAKTNTITATIGSTAPQIDVGDNSQAAGSPTIQSVLALGQTNGIFADSISVGRGKTDNNGALLNFNSAFSSPTAYFRGTNGAASRVGTWTIGDGYGSKSFYAYGACDFSLGTVSALVGTMYVGKGASTANGSGANDPGTGTLTLAAGTMDVNTLEVGYSINAMGTGTVNANGGSLLVNTFLELAHGSGSSGTLNIAGGIVAANAGVTAGGGSATLAMTGGTLMVTNSATTVGTAVSPINTFNIANAALTLAVQSTEPSVAVANLTAGGTANPINISSVPLLTGFPAQFPVIQYGLNGGSAGGDLTTFILGTLPAATPAYGAYISNNVANNSIDIVFTNGPSVPALTWDGVPNGNWNTVTANWKPKSGPDTAYAQGNFVTFDDSLSGTPNVNLTTTMTPGSITVSNSAASYVFSGTGSISGSTALVKNGSGTLTLSETNGDNFSGGIFVNNGTVVLDNANSAISGGTTINAGTVQVGNNDANGNLPSGGIADGGALVFDSATNLFVANAISGSGTLAQNDTNIVTLAGNSSFTGTATVAQGTLQVGSTNGLGLATGVTVDSGATFDLNGFALFGNGNSNLVVMASGAGNGAGAIVNNSTNNVSKALHLVTLTGDTTLGGTANWDIRNSSSKGSGPDGQLNGAFNLTKVGTNTISLNNLTVDSGLENISVQAGTLDVANQTTTLGDPSATVTVFTNATLTLDTLVNVMTKVVILNSGATLKGSSTNGAGGPVTLNGPVTLAGSDSVVANSGALLMLENTVGGPGSLTKSGSGTVFLAASNTYSGSTVVSGGTLALYGGGSDGSISSSVNINVTSGATLDASGRSNGTMTLVSGQTLAGGVGTNGPGTINGNFVANLGSIVAPGTGTTNIGTLSVVSNATLQGTTMMKISAAGGNDQLEASGITYGGSLAVTNFSGAVTNGQTFQLFVATNGVYNAGNFSSVTLPSAAGLTWTNNLTNNGTITAGVKIIPSPRPIITNIGLLGANLHLNGTNGASGGTLYVLASTNLALAITNWTAISTNTFTGSGTFNVTVTNILNPNVPQSFYIISQPY